MQYLQKVLIRELPQISDSHLVASDIVARISCELRLQMPHGARFAALAILGNSWLLLATAALGNCSAKCERKPRSCDLI